MASQALSPSFTFSLSSSLVFSLTSSLSSSLTSSLSFRTHSFHGKALPLQSWGTVSTPQAVLHVLNNISLSRVCGTETTSVRIPQSINIKECTEREETPEGEHNQRWDHTSDPVHCNPSKPQSAKEVPETQVRQHRALGSLFQVLVCQELRQEMALGLQNSWLFFPRAGGLALDWVTKAFQPRSHSQKSLLP